jgi:hypothetical protein
MSDDILARLKEMASGGAEPAAKPKAATVAKAQPVVEATAPVAVLPLNSVIPQSVPTVTKATTKSAAVPVPVVVLDDGSTFSNLRGCKVCFVSPDCQDIDEEALATGIRVSDLLTLSDAFRTILQVVR